MKKLYPLLLTLLSFSIFSNTLTANAIDDLDEVIDFANAARNNAKTARTAANDLAVLYFQLNDDNISGYIQVIINEMNQLESNTDEINFFIQSAASQNSNIDPTNIQSWAGQMEGLGDDVTNKAFALEQLIQTGQRSAARAKFRSLKADLNQIISLAKQVRDEAKFWKTIAQTYDVRIELIYYGQVYNGSTTLGGFYAYNQDLDEYFYPTQTLEDKTFIDLPGGTYTFGSFDGYFDGTNTVDVTLNSNLEGSDGFIVIQLNYWSE